MTRLVIDARLSGHSGIGVFALRAWRPVVLAPSMAQTDLASRLGADADIVAADIPPLGFRNLWSAPGVATCRDLLWIPHFNAPLVGTTPLAITLNDLLPISAPRLAGRGRAVPVRLWLRAIRARARVVFCISEFTRGEAIALGGLDPIRLAVTPLGVDRIWSTVPTAAPHQHDGDVPSPTIVFVGLLKPHKNVARLLQAFDQVKARIPHRLVLVARHEGLRHVDHDAIRLLRALGDRVALVSDLPLAELIARVGSAAFVAIPSLHEGFGLPALEAMAAGTPVLAGRAGALPEVCGDAAEYCDPWSVEDIARGLLTLATDPALRARLAAAGRSRASIFTWDRCAETTAEALEAALQALPGPAKR
jgi:glycosyltransferase involved in cell wall biosynthesis